MRKTIWNACKFALGFLLVATALNAPWRAGWDGTGEVLPQPERVVVETATGIEVVYYVRWR